MKNFYVRNKETGQEVMTGEKMPCLSPSDDREGLKNDLRALWSDPEHFEVVFYDSKWDKWKTNQK